MSGKAARSGKHGLSTLVPESLPGSATSNRSLVLRGGTCTVSDLSTTSHIGQGMIVPSRGGCIGQRVGLGRGLTSSRNLVPDLAKSLLFSVRVSVQPDEFAFTDLRARSWSRPASSRGPRSCAVSLNFTHCHRRMATSHESSTELLQQQHRAAASASAPACRHEAARGTAHEPRDLQPACAHEVL